MSWYDERFPKPEMTEEEFSFLASHLNQDTSLLEYGSGHSTPNLAPLVKKLTTVDHHPEWYEKVKGMCEEFDNVEHVLVPLNKPRVIPEGWGKTPEARYGFPTPWECVVDYSTWPLTQQQPMRPELPRKWHVVFIDGRARQWVGEFVRRNLWDNSIMFVHDYPERERYFTLENSYDKIEVVGTLAKFKLKV